MSECGHKWVKKEGELPGGKHRFFLSSVMGLRVDKRPYVLLKIVKLRNVAYSSGCISIASGQAACVNQGKMCNGVVENDCSNETHALVSLCRNQSTILVA